MDFTTWFEMHIFLALLFGWFVFKTRKSESPVRFVWIGLLIINVTDFFIGLGFPDYRIPFR